MLWNKKCLSVFQLMFFLGTITYMGETYANAASTKYQEQLPCHEDGDCVPIVLGCHYWAVVHKDNVTSVREKSGKRVCFSSTAPGPKPKLTCTQHQCQRVIDAKMFRDKKKIKRGDDLLSTLRDERSMDINSFYGKKATFFFRKLQKDHDGSLIAQLTSFRWHFSPIITALTKALPKTPTLIILNPTEIEPATDNEEVIYITNGKIQRVDLLTKTVTIRNRSHIKIAGYGSKPSKSKREYRTFNATGGIRSKGEVEILEDGTRKGIEKTYFDNGQLHKIIETRNGVLHGKHVEYDVYGAFSKGQMVDGKREGIFTFYLADGTVSSKREYHDGKIIHPQPSRVLP